MKLFEGKYFGFPFFLTGSLLLAGGLVLTQPYTVLADQSARHVNEKVFFSKVRKLIHRRGMKDIQFQTYKQIINYWNSHSDMNDRRWLAYVLATAYHETQLRPVREGFKKTDAQSRRHVTRMWNRRQITLPYHRPDRTTGHVYYGRGYVQLTWAENYKKMGRAIGMGDRLYRDPDLVLDPEIASKILFVGMLKGKFRYSKRKAPKGWQKLRMFFNGNHENWYRARNIINGDLRKNGNRIAGYGRKYVKAIRFQQGPVKSTAPTPDPDPEIETGDGEVVPVLPGVEVVDAGVPIDTGSNEGTTSGTTEPTEAGAPAAVDPPATLDEANSGGPPEQNEPAGSSATVEPTGEIVEDVIEEVVPTLPEQGEIAPDDPEVTPDNTAAPAEIISNPNDENSSADELEVMPIPIDHPELIEPEATLDERPSGNTPPVLEQDVSHEGSVAPDVVNPQEDVLQPAEKKGWWGKFKSLFAKYKHYVWKS